MKSLQNQYNLIKEGKGSKDVFIKSAKTQFPDIPNYYGFNETVNELKYRNILNEGMLGIVSSQPTVPDWFKLFNESVNEAKAEEKKPTKEVVDMETRGFDYKDKKNIDNVYGEQFLKGFYTEMQDPKNEEKTVEELKSIVAKNLAKDQLHYVKDGQFGIKGIGYTTEHPGLGTPKEAKGKYKSSGYGNLKESYGSDDDFDGTGLIVVGRTQLDNNSIADMVDETDYYGVWNAREGYWFFPENEETLDSLEMELEQEFSRREINARFEGQFNESLNNKQYYKNIAHLDKKGLAKKQFSDEDIQKAKKMLSNGEFNLNENTLVDIENQLLDANIGDMAYGGGYGPFEKVTRNTWKNIKAGSLQHSKKLASFIGGFNDFRIESSRSMSENQIRKAIRLIIKEELNKI